MGTIVALVLIGFMIYSVSNNWEIVDPAWNDLTASLRELGEALGIQR